MLSVRATGISLPSRSQRCNVLTETPRSFAALPVLIVLSMSIIIHYRVLYGKLESNSLRVGRGSVFHFGLKRQANLLKLGFDGGHRASHIRDVLCTGGRFQGFAHGHEILRSNCAGGTA